MLGSHEKGGGGLPHKGSCDDFNNWTNSRNYTHIPSRGAEFTWSNYREASRFTEMRLDRAIINSDWLSYWSSVSCDALVRNQSDHSPLLLSLSKGIKLSISFQIF